MIKIEDTRLFGWEAAITGMRNPLNSWNRSDTNWDKYYSSRDIKVMGADSSSLKISTDKVDFVAFKCKDLINELQQQESGHITIIGRPQINEWNGKKRLQMMIDDIDVFNNQETDSALDLI